jgi:hypothetical protein
VCGTKSSPGMIFFPCVSAIGRQMEAAAINSGGPDIRPFWQETSGTDGTTAGDSLPHGSWWDASVSIARYLRYTSLVAIGAIGLGLSHTKRASPAPSPCLQRGPLLPWKQAFHGYPS